MNWMTMPLKRYADFQGRSRRQEFWMWQLLKLLVSFIFLIVIGAIFGVSALGMSSGGSPGTGAMVGMGIGVIVYLLLLVLSLAIIVPDIAVNVRRLHDTNRSGLYLLLPILPYIIGYVLTVVGAMNQSAVLAIVGGVLVFAGMITAFVLLVFMCLPGTVGPNRFGADPLEAERGYAAGGYGQGGYPQGGYAQSGYPPQSPPQSW